VPQRTATATHWLDTLDRLLLEMIAQQDHKLLELARQIVPTLTPEDLRNPQDFSALMRDATFNYEDGLLAGLRSAHRAVRAELLRADASPARRGETPPEAPFRSHSRAAPRSPRQGSRPR
jgi:hypothetical protein